MKNGSIIKTIKERIRDSQPGSIFVAADFTDIAKSETVNTMLARLCLEGVLRRIKWGLYEYPDYNAFLGEYVTPSPDLIARAIARNYDWKIAPSGANALNQLGLSTQVPTTLMYACDGAYKEYEFGKTKIKFKKTSNSDFVSDNEKTALVIQALKAIGRKNINENTLATITAVFSPDDLRSVTKAAQHTNAWVSKYLMEVLERRTRNEEYCEIA